MEASVEKGWLFIITGTSGSGRRTVTRTVAKQLGLRLVLSYTTRAPRPHERDGEHYRFVDRSAFIEADIRGEFIETAEIDGTYYGIKRVDLEEALAVGDPAYVIVNRYGANRLKFEYGSRAVRLFIYAGKQVVMERLEAHGASGEMIDRYLNHYMEEVTYRRECEHVFENMELDKTVASVRSTIESYVKEIRAV